jgi:ABC-2 type transport system ATP-binding protein
MLVIENLNKSYGSYKAVNNLNLNISKGEIFGFVGPNGAGKTTTLKMMSTLLLPNSGEIKLNGENIYNNLKKTRSSIGYMPDAFGLYDNLKVHEYIEFYGELVGMNYKEIRNHVGSILELVSLEDKKNAYVDSLSRGMKQRLCLSRALIHNPELLILDEPASGMDPRARIQMKEILKELKAMGKTIIISSHILPELAELCSTIGVIDRGKIIQKGSVDEINSIIYGGTIVKVKYLESKIDPAILISERADLEIIYKGHSELELKFEGDDSKVAEINKFLVNSGIPVISFNKIDNNLEDIFIKLTGGESNE